MEINKEKETIKSLIAGDIDALEAIYNRYSEIVLNHCYKIVLNRQIAEDLMHDIFVELPNTSKSFNFKSSFTTWLYRVVNNKCLMNLRQQKNRLRIVVENIIPFSKSHAEASDYGDEINDDLNKALKKLDPTSRSMLWLKDAEELSIEELVDIFNQPAGTIKSKLSRSRKKLRESMNKEVSYE